MERDYERDTEINPHALHDELVEQANTFAYYSKKKAHAEAKVRRAEEKVKVTRSEICLEVAKDFEGTLGLNKEGGTIKPTAPMMEAYYRTDPRHREAKKELHDAEYQLGLMNTAVFSLQMKKMSLENLVRLAGMEYFAGPITPLEFNKKEARDKIRERTKND